MYVYVANPMQGWVVLGAWQPYMPAYTRVDSMGQHMYSFQCIHPSML